MEEVLERIRFIAEIIIEILQILPVVLTFPVVLLIIIIIFNEPLSKLIFSFSQYISTKATTMAEKTIIEPRKQYQTPVHKDSSSNVHQSLAQAYTAKGSYDEAIPQYIAAIKADPENVSSYIGLGNAYYKKGLHSHAIRSLEKAVEIKPYWADCRCNLGAAYSLANMHDKAIEEFVQAININPNYAAAHYGLGIAYISASKFDKASEQVEVLKDLDISFANKLQKQIEETKQKEETLKSSQESNVESNSEGS